MEENKLAIFEGKHIRKTIHNNEWWFSIIDVIEVLTDSSIPKRYWSDLKRKLVKEGYSELYENIVQLKFPRIYHAHPKLDRKKGGCEPLQAGPGLRS